MRLTGSFANKYHGKKVLHMVQHYSLRGKRSIGCHYGLRTKSNAQGLNCVQKQTDEFSSYSYPLVVKENVVLTTTTLGDFNY